MRPEIIKIFGITIHSYGLMIVIGFLLVIWIGGHEVRRRGIPDRLSDVAMVFLLCGIFGARVFHYLEFYDTNYAGKGFLAFFKVWEGGLVFYGGAIGGLLGGFVFMKLKNLPVTHYMDIGAILGPLGMAFGRLGCFMNGCCYGKVCSTDFAMGVVFPPTSPAAERHEQLHWIQGQSEALPVHPVQLYQGLHDFLLFVALWCLFRFFNPPRGVGMPLVISLYGIGRFFLEGLRGDNLSTPTGLTISQNVSILLASVFGLITIYLFWRSRNSGPISPATS